MLETLTLFFENLGFRKVPEQLEFLLNPENIPFAIWETLYAPLAATVLAYVIGLPLGILLVTGEEGGVRPLPKTLMRVLNAVINLLRSIPFLILMVVVMPLSRLILGTSVGTAATIVPLTVVNNLSTFIFGLIRAVGLILLGWGIVQVGLSLQSHDPSQRSNGFLTLAGGIVITFAKEILTLITGG